MSDYVLDLAKLLLSKDKKITTAESCTGGLVAKMCTDIAGSSAWFDRGFVTYSNQSKQDMLAVPQKTITQYGAVSEQVVGQMALGALANSQANFSLSISGVAGPSGGSVDKPLGMVWFGFAIDSKLSTECMNFVGDREQVRKQSAEYALMRMLEYILSKD